MYRKNRLSGRGYREPVPRSCHAHGIPFPGDSISFRLPRSLPAPSRREALRNRPTVWPVLSLNNGKHPAKSSRPGYFYRVSMSSASSWVVLHRLPCRQHFLKNKLCFSTFKDKKGVLQSTSIVKRSTPSNMYRILFTVFKCMAGIPAPSCPAAFPQCQGCAARTSGSGI